MKIKQIFISLFASMLVLCGCDNSSGDGIVFTKDDKTFFDITNIAVSNIDGINVSKSIKASAAFRYKSDDYSFLNTRFTKVDSNIHDLFYETSTNNNNPERAIVLEIIAKEKNNSSTIKTFSMFISYETHYLYYGDEELNNANQCYRSKNAITDKYIDKLLNQDGDGDEYYLTVNGGSNIASGLPKSGYYVENHTFLFKIEIVTDVSFSAYLNNELLTPYKRGNSLGEYDCYSFEMPSENATLTITSDQFFVDRDYTFNELFYWVDYLTEENVKGIRIETGAIGVPRESANAVVKYSEDERDISYNLNILKNAPLEKATNDIEGGQYLKISFVLELNEYTVETRNEYVDWYDFSSYQYFKIKDSFTDFFNIQYELENN